MPLPAGYACRLKLQQEKHKNVKERRRQEEKEKKEEHIRRLSTLGGADISLELLASWATPEPPPPNRIASILARFIIPQRHAMTQVAHMARAQIFANVLQRRQK